MDNITEYQYAWAIYLIGALGCALATWLLFRGMGRVVTHFMVITVLVSLLTPYAIDAEKMTMAPGIFTLAFGFFDGGLPAIKPLLKVMLGIWAVAQLLSLIYQLLTRHNVKPVEYRPFQQYAHQQPNSSETDGRSTYGQQRQPERTSSRGLSREERMARDELLFNEPIRATR